LYPFEHAFATPELSGKRILTRTYSIQHITNSVNKTKLWNGRPEATAPRITIVSCTQHLMPPGTAGKVFLARILPVRLRILT
jgi:hypothetical protein